MTPEQLQQQINELQSRINELESRLDLNRFEKVTDKFTYKSLTAGAPATSGHITVEINGINRNLMITT